MNTRGYEGTHTKEDGEPFRYYGLINNMFSATDIEYVRNKNIKIIQLPNEYPKVMEVSETGDIWGKRVVFMEKCGRYLGWMDAETLEEAENRIATASWKYAREIQQPQQLELTIDQIAEKFGVPSEQIKIKK